MSASDDPIRTVGNMTMEVKFDHGSIDPKVMAILFGIDRYIDEYGKHRIHNESLWEARSFDELMWGVPKFSRTFIFNTGV